MRRRSLREFGIPDIWTGCVFEIDSRFDGAKHFVGRTKDPAEEAELFGQQFEHPTICLVPLIEEVDDDNVVFLTITMAPANTLLDALRIPRQVVVNDERQNCRFTPSAAASVASKMFALSRKCSINAVRMSNARDPDARPVPRLRAAHFS